MKRSAVACLVLPFTFLLAAYYGAPHWFATPLVNLNRRIAGLTERTVLVGEYRVHYLEGGHGATLVLLHGIFAEKDHWVDFAGQLTRRYHVVIPDLPGFGASGRLPGGIYDYAAQTQRLAELLQTLGIRKAHLAGSSMGGTLAAEFAIAHPERVASVAFIGAPHGLRTPIESETDRLVDSGASPLIAASDDAFDALLPRLFARRPFLPYPIWYEARQRALRDAPSNRLIWQQHVKDRYLLQGDIARLDLPIFALWGAEDRVFDASGAPLLRAAVKQGQVVVLPGIGHLPMMEAPAAASHMYAEFLATLGGNAHDPALGRE